MKIINCRLCGSAQFERVIDLGFHPLADTFLTEDVLYDAEVHYPLQLGLCLSCGHVSTMHSVSAVDRYQKHDYSYDSSNSKVSIAHFREFAEAVIAVRRPRDGGLIVDIGSNVGTLLSHFKDLGYTNVLGIEPAKNIAAMAIKSGIPTLNDFFGPDVVTPLQQFGNGVDVLLSSNVVNHADDLRGLLDTARAVLSPDGIFVFEVPYLFDLIRRTAFDTIYHEHVHYYGIKPLATCLATMGFSIFKVDLIEYMCGSMRVYCRLGTRHAEVVQSLVRAETAAKLYEPETYAQFMHRVKRVKLSVLERLARIRAEGGRIVGIGAATKGNTLLNYCRLDSDTIECIADASPLKIGKLTPGSHIPIISDDDIDKGVTHALILPWNIAPMLESKLAHLQLTFYVPQVETLSDLNH